MKPLPLSNTLRPSGCPGLLRIVQALDGGICRIKLSGGALRAEQALVVADAARRYAGGVIEATNRANLQIRGIGAEHQALIAQLLGAGLGPTTAGGDDVRNLMLSPGAGIDRDQLCDTRPLAEQILATLQADPRFHQLSAKFAVQLDGGEALAMREHPHDLWLSAYEAEGEVRLAFGLAGCPAHQSPVAAVPLAQGYALVIAVLQRFLALARPDQHRLRDLLGETSVAEFIEGLPLPLLPAVGYRRRDNPAHLRLGTYPQRQPEQHYVAALAPLGRLDASMLQGAAQLAIEHGDGTLRFTPWQGLLLPNLSADNAARVSAGLARLGFLGAAEHPLSRLIACTGSSGCAKALADTKADARHLASLLAAHVDGPEVHLSGCLRTCAAAHTAPVTLLAVSPGHYDLYFREAGQPGFGRLHARTLSIDAAGALLRARPRSNTHD